eukprot:g3103.t1
MLIMEYAENGDLLDVIFSPENNCNFDSFLLDAMVDVGLGIEFLHERAEPILHRDIKTANILISENFTCKIADFGESVLQKNITDAVIAGSPYYIAPEILAEEKYDCSADIFSFGITIFEMMVYVYLYTHANKSMFRHIFMGRRAIEYMMNLNMVEEPSTFSMSGETQTFQLAGKGRQTSKRMLSGWRPRISPVLKTLQPQLVDLIEKCLKHDPSQRLSIKTINDILQNQLQSEGYVQDIGNDRSLTDPLYLSMKYRKLDAESISIFKDTIKIPSGYWTTTRDDFGVDPDAHTNAEDANILPDEPCVVPGGENCVNDMFIRTYKTEGEQSRIRTVYNKVAARRRHSKAKHAATSPNFVYFMKAAYLPPGIKMRQIRELIRYWDRSSEKGVPGVKRRGFHQGFSQFLCLENDFFHELHAIKLSNITFQEKFLTIVRSIVYFQDSQELFDIKRVLTSQEVEKLCNKKQWNAYVQWKNGHSNSNHLGLSGAFQIHRYRKVIHPISKKVVIQQTVLLRTAPPRTAVLPRTIYDKIFGLLMTKPDVARTQYFCKALTSKEATEELKKKILEENKKLIQQCTHGRGRDCSGMIDLTELKVVLDVVRQQAYEQEQGSSCDKRNLRKKIPTYTHVELESLIQAFRKYLSISDLAAPSKALQKKLCIQRNNFIHFLAFLQQQHIENGIFLLKRNPPCIDCKQQEGKTTTTKIHLLLYRAVSAIHNLDSDATEETTHSTLLLKMRRKHSNLLQQGDVLHQGGESNDIQNNAPRDDIDDGTKKKMLDNRKKILQSLPEHVKLAMTIMEASTVRSKPSRSGKHFAIQKPRIDINDRARLLRMLRRNEVERVNKVLQHKGLDGGSQLERQLERQLDRQLDLDGDLDSQPNLDDPSLAGGRSDLDFISVRDGVGGYKEYFKSSRMSAKSENETSLGRRAVKRGVDSHHDDATRQFVGSNSKSERYTYNASSSRSTTYHGERAALKDRRRRSLLRAFGTLLHIYKAEGGKTKESKN